MVFISIVTFISNKQKTRYCLKLSDPRYSYKQFLLLLPKT